MKRQWVERKERLSGERQEEEPSRDDFREVPHGTAKRSGEVQGIYQISLYEKG